MVFYTRNWATLEWSLTGKCPYLDLGMYRRQKIFLPLWWSRYFHERTWLQLLNFAIICISNKIFLFFSGVLPCMSIPQRYVLSCANKRQYRLIWINRHFLDTYHIEIELLFFCCAISWIETEIIEAVVEIMNLSIFDLVWSWHCHSLQGNHELKQVLDLRSVSINLCYLNLITSCTICDSAQHRKIYLMKYFLRGFAGSIGTFRIICFAKLHQKFAMIKLNWCSQIEPS